MFEVEIACTLNHIDKEQRMKLKILLAICFLIVPLFSFAAEYDELIGSATRLIESEPEKARAALAKAVMKYPGFGDAYILNGLIYYRIDDDPVRAGAEFKKGIERIGDIELKNRYLKLINDTTTAFRSQQEYDLFAAAFAAIEERKSKTAVEYLLKAIELNRNNARLYYEIGYAYIELKEFDKARRYLEEGRKINPVSSKILSELKFVYSEFGETLKVQEIILDMIGCFGDQPMLFQELAFSYYKAEKKDMAIRTLEQNIKKYPSFLISYFTLGQIYHEGEKCDKARIYLGYFINNSSEKDFEGYRMDNDHAHYLNEAKRMVETCK
jgi:tetratricopeptide (TPR) repeat protein